MMQLPKSKSEHDIHIPIFGEDQLVLRECDIWIWNCYLYGSWCYKKTVLATWLKDLFIWVNPCLCDTWTIKVFFIYLANKRRRRGSCWKKLCSKCFNWLPPKKKSLEARSGSSSLDAKTIFRTIIQLLFILVYLFDYTNKILCTILQLHIIYLSLYIKFTLYLIR